MGMRALPGAGWIPWIGVVVVLLAWAAIQLASPPEREEVRATLSAAEALAGGDTAGFARAMEPRDFVFPDDHGPHPEYRTEWWYLTGHLDAEDGRAFGFQLTFFRNSLTPEPPDRASAWSTNQLWMGHFALTDVTSGTHGYEERFARGAVGLAGATASPFRVWLEDWELSALGPDGAFPFRLRATLESGEELELVVEEGRPPVLQGDRGLSQKGPEPGNASYYLSWTRMQVRGHVRLPGEARRGEARPGASRPAELPVTGEAWMDREWSTSALGEVHLGWDWFSLQLDDGSELMFFELRRADGAPEPLNHGALVAPDGTVVHLAADQVDLEVLERWASPLDGTVYPSGWRLRVPGQGIDLTLTPRVPDQEMNVTFRYWEGALEVAGRSGDRTVGGRGYAELTGYAASETRPPS